MDMKNNDIEELIERLQGFDAEELRHDMTDGLEQWCNRRVKRAHTVRRMVAMLLVLCTLSAVAMTASPTLRHTVFTPKEETPVNEPPCTPTPSAKEAQQSADTVVLDVDTVAEPEMVVVVPETRPSVPRKRYDFVTFTDRGDTLFCTIVRVARSVSVSTHGIGTTHPAGVMVLPAKVEYDGLIYSVTGLSDSAFYNCRELSAIILPATVATIGRDAFSGCSALDSIVSLAVQPPRIKGEWCFWEVPPEAVLSVPCHSGTAYRSAHCWDYFDSIADPCAPPPTPEIPYATIKVRGHDIVVEGVYNEVVRVYDIEGRLLESQVCNGTCRFSVYMGYGHYYAGPWLVQVGDQPPLKVGTSLMSIR